MEVFGFLLLFVLVLVLFSRASTAETRVVRLEREREELERSLKDAYGRIVHLEQGMNEAWRWLQGLRGEQERLLARPPAPAALSAPAETATAEAAPAEPIAAPIGA